VASPTDEDREVESGRWQLIWDTRHLPP